MLPGSMFPSSILATIRSSIPDFTAEIQRGIKNGEHVQSGIKNGEHAYTPASERGEQNELFRLLTKSGESNFDVAVVCG